MRYESRVIDGHVIRVPNLDNDPITDPDAAALDHAITGAQDALLHVLFDPEHDSMNDTNPNMEPHNDNQPDSGTNGEAGNNEPPGCPMFVATTVSCSGGTDARVEQPGAAVARMVQLRRWGVSLRVICAVLTAEGYLTARHGRWHASQVLRVLRRELGPEVTARYGQRAGRPHKDGRPARHRREYVTVPPELRELADELDRLPPGTVVAGVDVSGLPLDEAMDVVRPLAEPDWPRDYWPPTAAEELRELAAELRGHTRDEVLETVRLLRSEPESG
ncbi:hypothetical protein [Haloechinothrix salitolerans]|uniref:Golgi phosphoprotein 3 (GPP34) n=1 Tax=Haloechinothrix salitolerans TaxID=926830 RepID=A0ABW2C4U9_9PSEU